MKLFKIPAIMKSMSVCFNVGVFLGDIEYKQQREDPETPSSTEFTGDII